jgi:hypothetical protein
VDGRSHHHQIFLDGVSSPYLHGCESHDRCRSRITPTTRRRPLPGIPVAHDTHGSPPLSRPPRSPPQDGDDGLGHAGPSSIRSLEQMNSASLGWRQGTARSLAWLGRVESTAVGSRGAAGEPVLRLRERDTRGTSGHEIVEEIRFRWAPRQVCSGSLQAVGRVAIPE